MRIFESVSAILSGSILVVVIVLVFVAAILGKDLVLLDHGRATNPKQYRRIRWVCRINCPLGALLCIGGIIVAPFEAISPDGSLPVAAVAIIGACLGIWLNIRWFLWSVRPPHGDAKTREQAD